MKAWFWRRKENAVRVIKHVLTRTEDSDQLVYLIIPGCYVVVTNRPVIAIAICTFAFEVFRAEAE
jgi:hypothetical protein